MYPKYSVLKLHSGDAKVVSQASRKLAFCCRFQSSPRFPSFMPFNPLSGQTASPTRVDVRILQQFRPVVNKTCFSNRAVATGSDPPDPHGNRREGNTPLRPHRRRLTELAVRFPAPPDETNASNGPAREPSPFLQTRQLQNQYRRPAYCPRVPDQSRWAGLGGSNGPEIRSPLA